MVYKTSRKEALQAGETRYIGSPCIYGHGSIRYTGNWECIVCRRRAKQKNKHEKRKKFSLLRKAVAKTLCGPCRPRIGNNKKRYTDEQLLKRQRIRKAKYRSKNKDKINAYKAKRRAAKLNRTPAWLRPVDFKYIQEIYTIAKRLTEKTGELYHVDHIIPLQGEIVSGLHVPTNLQVIKAADNLKKNNIYPPSSK